MSLIVKENIEIIPYLPEGREKEVYNALLRRFEQLELARENSAIDAIWDTVDKIYPPHEFDDSTLKQWMSKNSVSICFEKVQTALSIFLERNPESTITAGAKQYIGKELLIKELFKHNHRITKFDNTKEKFDFNLLRYGTAYSRTYSKKINNLDEPFSETLNVRDVWIDDMAKPLDMTTIRDWMFRKIYQYEDLIELFPASEYPNIKYVTIGGETEKEVTTPDKEYTSLNQVEVKFYETAVSMNFQDGGRQENMFAIMANDVLLYWGEIPYKHKRLSLWMAQLYLRDTESPYGIGIPEIIKGEQNIIDKILNMSINELALAIHPTGFFSGTTNFDKDFYEVEPGKLQKVSDTDKLIFINRNSNSTIGVANDAVDKATERIERSTGVSKILSGQEVSGKTAFEVSQAKESGLRRLIIPVNHIKDALETEGNLTIDLIQELYTQPILEKLIEPEKLAEYVENNKENPFIVETDEGIKEQQFREIPLNVKKDKEKIVPSKEKEIWNITPDEIQFEGELEIDAESMLVTSKEVEAQKTIEMYQMLTESPNVDSRKLDELLIKDGFRRDPADILISEEEALAKQKAVIQANEAQTKISGIQQEMSAIAPAIAPAMGGGRQNE